MQELNQMGPSDPSETISELIADRRERIHEDRWQASQAERDRSVAESAERMKRVDDRLGPPPFAPTGAAYDHWMAERARILGEEPWEMASDETKDGVKASLADKVGRLVLNNWSLAKQVLNLSPTLEEQEAIWELNYDDNSAEQADDVARTFATTPEMDPLIYLQVLESNPEDPELARSIAAHPDLDRTVSRLCRLIMSIIETDKTRAN